MKRWFPALVLLVFFVSDSTNAQNASSLSDVHLTIRIQGDRSTFRVGEIIPLELSFTSRSPGTYKFGYDRSGRLNAESFAIEPKTGWDDPLYIYFHSYQGFIGGGLRGEEILSEKPTTIREDLNEWIRFKEPGNYKVTITSTRVSKLHSNLLAGAVKVTSNVLPLTIVSATKEWQAATLATALAALDSPQTAGPIKSGQPSSQQQAAKVLRYLGTADGARAMARRLADTKWDWDFAAGLAGSPARLQNDNLLEELAIKALGDDDARLVEGAAVYLQRYGSPSAEDLLWSRFIRWSAQWKGREDELEYQPGRPYDNMYEAGAGQALMQALASGHGWLTDETKLRRLLDLSVGQQRLEVQQFLAIWHSRPWRIEFIPFGKDGQFQIAQYHEFSLAEAKEKLLQFPQGTTFVWSGTPEEPSQKKAYQEFSSIASEKGFRSAANH